LGWLEHVDLWSDTVTDGLAMAVVAVLAVLAAARGGCHSTYSAVAVAVARERRGTRPALRLGRWW
jgi:hypothetical protein